MKTVKIITLSPKEIEEAVVAYYKLSNNTIITQLDKDGISITDYGDEGVKKEEEVKDNVVKVYKVSCGIWNFTNNFNCEDIKTAKTLMYLENNTWYKDIVNRKDNIYTKEYIKNHMRVEELE